MTASPFFSIVIPVYNAAGTIEECLGRILASSPADFELIVVDDGSSDGSGELARRFRATVIGGGENRGPSAARNAGAGRARGRFLLFTDADCLFEPDLLAKTRRIVEEEGVAVLGGTYHPRSADGSFVSDFHALYAFFYETRKDPADYLAAHYLVVERELFLRAGGFRVGRFLGRRASHEDVELSRRLAALGLRLTVRPELTVRHYFRFNALRSLRNAARKSYMWSQFRLAEGRPFGAVGVASGELQATFALSLLAVLSAGAAWFHPAVGFLALLFSAAAVYVNRSFLAFVRKERGGGIAAGVAAYYIFPYSLAVGLGAALLLVQAPFRPSLRER